MFCIINFMFYFCFTILKANHNKDYSVVKTFKWPSSYNTGVFF